MISVRGTRTNNVSENWEVVGKAHSQAAPQDKGSRNSRAGPQSVFI